MSKKQRLLNAQLRFHLVGDINAYGLVDEGDAAGDVEDIEVAALGADLLDSLENLLVDSLLLLQACWSFCWLS